MNKQIGFRKLIAIGLLACAPACENSFPAEDVTPRTPGTPSTPSTPTTPTTPQAPKGETLTSGDWSMVLPLGLQASRAYIPADNPISQAKIVLGKVLYFDKRLSADNTVACATCHIPARGGTDNAPVSTGIRGQKGGRSAPSMVNRLFSVAQFWDGRAPDLEAQAKGPIANPIEMGNTHEMAVATIIGIEGYRPLFTAAFGNPEVTMDKIAKAIATYERVVLAGNAPYDRYKAGDKNAMSPAAVRGMAIFESNEKGRCALCHRGFNFTGEDYKALGVGMDALEPDPGRYAVTKKESDRGAFKTPTLRNVEWTGPYMHDGSVATLEAVMNYYDAATHASRINDPDFRPLNLSQQDIQDLVEFMKALTGEIVNADPPYGFPL